MAQHTPGPWKANPDFHEIQTDEGYGAIAKYTLPEDGPIIAIAPEALTALRNLYLYANDLVDYDTGMKDDSQLDINHVMENIERSLTEAAALLEKVGYLSPTEE